MKTTELRKERRSPLSIVRATVARAACACFAVMMVALTGCETGDDPADLPVDEEFTIPVNGADQWTPFPEAAHVDFKVRNGGIIDCSDDGFAISFTGLKAGDAYISAAADGDSRNAVVHVIDGGGNNPGGDPIIWDPKNPGKVDPKGPKDNWIGAFVYGELEYKLEETRKDDCVTNGTLFVRAPIVLYLDYMFINALKQVEASGFWMNEFADAPYPIGMAYSINSPDDATKKEMEKKDSQAIFNQFAYNPLNSAPVHFSYAGTLTCKTSSVKYSGEITTAGYAEKGEYSTPITFLMNKTYKSLTNYNYKLLWLTDTDFSDRSVETNKWVREEYHSQDGNVSVSYSYHIPSIYLKDWFKEEKDIEGKPNLDFNGITITKTDMEKLLNNPASVLKIPFDVILVNINEQDLTQHIIGTLTFN